MRFENASFLGRRAMLAMGLSAVGGVSAADVPAPAPAVGRIAGESPSVGDLRAMALANYGHFSTMRIRRRSVQGLDFQLARLDRSTRLLFGSELEGERVRRLVREAVPDDDRTDTRTLGERPGTNDAPLGPSFRDGPPRTPRSAAAVLAEAVPFLLLAVVVVLVVAGR